MDVGCRVLPGSEAALFVGPGRDSINVLGATCFLENEVMKWAQAWFQRQHVCVT